MKEKPYTTHKEKMQYKKNRRETENYSMSVETYLHLKYRLSWRQIKGIHLLGEALKELEHG